MSTEDARPEGAMLRLIGVWEMRHKCTNSPDGGNGVPLAPTSSVQLSHGFSSVSDPVFWPMTTVAAAGQSLNLFPFPITLGVF